MHQAIKNSNFKDITHDLLIFEAVMSDVIAYTRVVIDAVKPKEMVYIAIDGNVNVTKFEMKESFDTSHFETGTVFMQSLHIRMRSAINLGLFDVPMILFSDSNEPGTGRHKIFNHIRETEKKSIVYGLDLCNHTCTDLKTLVTCTESMDEGFCFQRVATCLDLACQSQNA
tara:strand:- start:8388 stop:8897 length:510 start_codon:yes stop_codon:yes gene_type:complete